MAVSQQKGTDVLDSSLLRTEQRTLLDYWQSLEAGGRIPSRAAVNPLDFPKLLKSIGLIDVVTEIGGDYRFRYRLIGTQINHIHGTDYTDQSVNDAEAGAYELSMAQLCRDTVTSRGPVFSRIRMTYADGRELETDRLVLPMASDGKVIDMLMFSYLFRSENLTFGLKPFRVGDIVHSSESLRLAA